jgi:hypothetical protein
MVLTKRLKDLEQLGLNLLADRSSGGSRSSAISEAASIMAESSSGAD